MCLNVRQAWRWSEAKYILKVCERKSQATEAGPGRKLKGTRVELRARHEITFPIAGAVPVSRERRAEARRQRGSAAPQEPDCKFAGPYKELKKK
jgi:hypothetical protein